MVIINENYPSTVKLTTLTDLQPLNTAVAQKVLHVLNSINFCKVYLSFILVSGINLCFKKFSQKINFNESLLCLLLAIINENFLRTIKRRDVINLQADLQVSSANC